MNEDILNQENIEESSDSIEKDNNNINNQDSAKQRRKRRSKHIQEGRVYQCDCGKSYLSIPALNNHKNSKHSTGGGNQEKRPRGRPRKYHVQDPKQLDTELIKFNSFFNITQAHGYRSNNSEESFNVPDVVKLVFDDIYVPYGDKCFKRPDNFTDHKLLEMLFLEKEPLLAEDKPKNENTCDEAFYQYMNYMKNLTNKNYFTLALKFVLLFRECLNISRSKELVSELENGVNARREYSALRNAETVPEICNEFVTDYLENNDYFGINSERDRNEIIELIQHFCTWLYVNGYTQSRLSLVS